MMPTCLAPSSLQQNNQFLRLWKVFHNRRYVQFVIMCTFASDLQIPFNPVADPFNPIVVGVVELLVLSKGRESSPE